VNFVIWFVQHVAEIVKHFKVIVVHFSARI
jgi:hypothetical protein